MNKNNQKGFTLILSLVLLLVMSLMGGSLIVIASSDHQSNNTSDEYQQTFKYRCADEYHVGFAIIACDSSVC